MSVTLQYFAEDGTQTEDCTEAETFRRSGSTEPLFRLVRDGLLGDEDMIALSQDQPFAGHHDPISALRGSANGCFGDAGAFVRAMRDEWP